MLSCHLAVGDAVAIASSRRSLRFEVDLAFPGVEGGPVRVVTTDFDVIRRELADLCEAFVRSRDMEV